MWFWYSCTQHIVEHGIFDIAAGDVIGADRYVSDTEVTHCFLWLMLLLLLLLRFRRYNLDERDHDVTKLLGSPARI